MDHYWHLPVEDAFDLTSEPSRFTVGQVCDDLDEVVRDEPDGIPKAERHDLSHLIGVLRAWSSPRDREAHSSADPRTHASQQIGTSPG